MADEQQDTPSPFDRAVAATAEGMYQAYGNAADWKNYQGNPMPQWSELPPNIQTYWRAAAIYAHVELTGGKTS
jgi:surface antigen